MFTVWMPREKGFRRPRVRTLQTSGGKAPGGNNRSLAGGKFFELSVPGCRYEDICHKNAKKTHTRSLRQM